MKKEFIVENFKLRLDKYLAGQILEVSRSQIQKDIEAGLVLVNGKKVLQGKFVVRKGNVVEYQISNSQSLTFNLKPINIPLKTLYDNHGLLIIDKPAGLPVHPGAGFKGNSLASALLYHFSAKGGSVFDGKDISKVGEEHRPGIVHRLDKDTSGVMLVAKSPEMYEYLKNAFAERKIKKEYIALARGHIENRHGFIDVPTGKSKTDFRKYDVKNVIRAKPSLTEYNVLEYLSIPSKLKGKGKPEGNNVDIYTLLLIKLYTGRTHQIRVHFNSVGHSLAGDLLYGPKKFKLKGLSRQFLHAKKIEVRLPDGTWIEAVSELADDLKDVLNELQSEVVNKL